MCFRGGQRTKSTSLHSFSLFCVNYMEDSCDVLQVMSEDTGKVDVVEEQCDLLVACDTQDINPALFQCIDDASLVYDGRLVVNEKFQTNDPRIFSSGTMAKFSRNAAPELRMENCNSREVGKKLGAALVREIMSHGPTAHSTGSRLCPLEFCSAKAVGCNLPGGAFFVFTSQKENMKSPSLDPPEVRTQNNCPIYSCQKHLMYADL